MKALYQYAKIAQSLQCNIPTPKNYVPRTSLARPHNVPYIISKDVPCRCHEDVLYRRPEDARQRPPEYALKTSFFGSITISKAEKCPRDKNFCIWSKHQ